MLEVDTNEVGCCEVDSSVCCFPGEHVILATDAMVDGDEAIEAGCWGLAATELSVGRTFAVNSDGLSVISLVDSMSGLVIMIGREEDSTFAAPTVTSAVTTGVNWSCAGELIGTGELTGTGEFT